MISSLRMRNVITRPIDWLWQPMIAFGKVTMIQGDTNIGKTNFLIKLMADLSRGIYPPTLYKGHLYEKEPGEPLRVYYVSTENNMEDTVAPFFDQFGGNRDYVDYQNERASHFVLSVDDIRDCVALTKARVIIVDPWQQFLNGISITDNEGIRDMLTKVQEAAEETDAAVILAGNYTKRGGSDMQRGMGASEFFNTIRSVLTIKKSPLDTSDNIPVLPDRIIEASKMSLKGKDSTPVVIRQNDDEILEFVDYRDMMDGNEAGLGRIVNGKFIRPETIGKTNSAVYDNGEMPAGPKAREAVAFLRRILANGPVDSNEVKRLVAESDISMPTVNRVKDFAGVEYDRVGRRCYWRLRGQSAN